MVFSSLLFLFRFLPIVLIIYYLVPKSWKNGILFLASLFFYSWGEPVYVVLLLFSTVVDYGHGKLVSGCLQKGNRRGAKGALFSSVFINLGLLGFFKYAGFFVGALNSGFGMQIPFVTVALPIGISFYTFQTMSYTIDVYRGKAKVQDSIIAFGAYVAMFPQLIAGPIVRYSTIADELRERKMTVDGFAMGIRYFVIGLGKKVLLANNMGLLWDMVKGTVLEERTVVLVWIGMLAFGMQIYFDFSGYSDMAVGLGRMFGFHFPENFNYPYISKSITEFWRRWHISLSTWFKEYVYIPLGGNRKGIGRQVRNILIVWMLTGVWHGAGWNFVVWGLYFGLLLILEKFLLGSWLVRRSKWLQGTYTLLLVFIGWVIFAFDGISDGVLYLRLMFGAGGIEFLNNNTIYILYTNLILIIIAIISATEWPKHMVARFMDKFGNVSLLLENGFYVAVMIVSVAYLVDASYNPFLYFRF